MTGAMNRAVVEHTPLDTRIANIQE